MNWARQLYSLATWAAQPLLRRKLRRRAVKEPGYAEAVPERFGVYSPASLGHDGRGQWVWIHAVSLGETRVAAILLKELRAQIPKMRLLLTHGTATGRAEGQKLLREGDVQVWQPWDSQQATARFVRQFQPAIGILMETEIWPNLIVACQQQGVPVTLANARLSDKSLQGALRIAPLSKPAYGALSAAWAQTDADAQRLRALGAPVKAVVGNIKFDIEPEAEQLAQGQRWRAAARGAGTGAGADADSRPIVMLASSREGEEAQWLEIFKAKIFEPNQPPEPNTPVQAATESIVNAQVQAQVKNPVKARLQWLIVPRHPQRFDEVAALLEQAGIKVSRRSSWRDGPEADADSDTVWLGDSLGELAVYYAMADVALLGASFEPLGGQNLIEAAACGCPVIMGPHTFNFAQAADMACEAGAALRATGMPEAVEKAGQLVSDAAALAATRQRALDFSRQHKGAAAATARAVRQLLASRGRG